ncbi:MAG: ribonuclease P protein component [Synergistaceae bacterium]|nr:ribonuclease P protein component [Synergistaceae bacterium]
MKNTFSIKKNYEFLRIYKKGKFYVGKNVILYVLKNQTGKYAGCNYIGITTSKKIGKSVKRNRLKRLVRENYRAIESYLFPGYSLVFVLRNAEETPNFWVLSKEMKYLLIKANILDSEKWEKRLQ